MTEEKAVTKQQPKATSIRQILEGEQFKQQVARALPSHLTADRFIRIACTTIMRTPKLAQCDQSSFFNALLTLSQLGIEPDGRRAHLIPFENRKRGVTEVQLIIDYKGIVELAMRSGDVANIHADVVCESDEFEYDLGEIKRHKIDFRKPRGQAFAAYAIVTFKDGTRKAEVMGADEIEGIRKRSRAGQSGPWVTDWNEMAKKTAFRRLSKWIRLSPEAVDAIHADDDRPKDFGHIEIPAPQPIKAAQVEDIPDADLMPSEPQQQPETTIAQPHEQEISRDDLMKRIADIQAHKIVTLKRTLAAHKYTIDDIGVMDDETLSMIVKECGQ